jgi:hypothetical protein
MLSISKQYSISDRMVDECGTVGGMKLVGVTKYLEKTHPNATHYESTKHPEFIAGQSYCNELPVLRDGWR